jgi:hypothetical protein
MCPHYKQQITNAVPATWHNEDYDVLRCVFSFLSLYTA